MTDRALAGAHLVEHVRRCVAAGVDQVQVRERALEGGALLAHVDALLAAARRGAEERGGGVRVVVNRRADVAMAAGADGVHLGFDAMGVAEARALLGPGAWIGVSAHSVAEVHAAARAGASYAHLAPVFDPLSKPAARPPLGAAALADVRHAGLPVLAQGGITARNARACAVAGGVAVTGALLAAPDPAEAARALREALDAPDAHPAGA